MPLRAKHAREDMLPIEDRIKEGKATISDVAKLVCLLVKLILDIRQNQVKIGEKAGVTFREERKEEGGAKTTE